MLRTRVTGHAVPVAGGYRKYVEKYNTTQKKWLPFSNTWYPFSLCDISTATITDVDPYDPNLTAHDRKSRARMKKSRDYHVVNQCTHVKEYTPRIASDNYGWVQTSSTERYKIVYSGYTNQASWSGYKPKWPTFWVSTLPHKEAVDHFNAGGVGNEVMLPNFLLELSEIRSLLTQFDPRRLLKIRDSWKASKELSGGFIAYNFGIAPLINDLQAIASYTQALEQRLEWLKSNQSQTVSLDFTKSLYKPPASVPISTGYWWKVVEYKQDYHAFCRWKVAYDPLKVAWEKLRYFNRYFGTSRLLATAWEATPWSFVVDWVTNVGDLFGSLELPTTLRPGITAVGYSQKEEIKCELCYLTPNQGPIRIGAFTRSRYERRPGLPISLSSSFQTNDPTGKQQALAFALFHQKMR